MGKGKHHPEQPEKKPTEPTQPIKHPVTTWQELQKKYDLPDEGGWLIISPVPFSPVPRRPSVKEG